MVFSLKGPDPPTRPLNEGGNYEEPQKRKPLDQTCPERRNEVAPKSEENLDKV